MYTRIVAVQLPYNALILQISYMEIGVVLIVDKSQSRNLQWRDQKNNRSHTSCRQQSRRVKVAL